MTASHTPERLQALIRSQGSLTAHLERLAGQPLRVRVLKEGWQSLSLDVRRTLGINRPCVGWVRQVALYGSGDAPWVRATSVFCVQALMGEARQLKHLKRKPIGYVLYRRQRTLSNARSFFCAKEGQGRRTLYDWQGRKLLIEEVFLPGLAEYLAAA